MANRQSFPTSSLFITLAVAALVTRLLLTALSGAEARTAFVLALTCGLVSAGVGLAMGMHAYRRASGSISGVFLGFLIGVMLGPLVLVKQSQINEIITLQLGGSALLIGLGVFFWLAKSDPLNRPRVTSGPPVVATLAEPPADQDNA